MKIQVTEEFLKDQERIAKIPHKVDGGILVEFTEEELQSLYASEPEELRLPVIKAEKVRKCKEYLVATGWYVERLMDPSSQEPIPEDVLAKRKLARDLQDKIDRCRTVKGLEAIDVSFE